MAATLVNILTTCQVDGHKFFPGLAQVPDELLEEMVAEGLCSPPVQLPPGTELRGMWWTDEAGEDHCNWVAWARMGGDGASSE